MDSMERFRRRALKCRELSRGYQRLSPAAREIVNKSNFSRDTIAGRFQYWAISIECERLIVVEDAATRIMVLSALRYMGHVSKHIGLIAALCYSDEVGESFFDGGVGSRKLCLGGEVRSYLNEILNVPESKFSNLFSTAKHWVGVLSWDYSKDPAITSGLSREKIAERVSEIRENQERLFFQSIKEEVQQIDAEDYEKKVSQVNMALELIIKHIREHVNAATNVDILEFLQQKVRRKDFPSEWLDVLCKKYNIHG